MAKQRIIPIIYKVDYSQVDKSTAAVKKAETATDNFTKSVKKTEDSTTKAFDQIKNAISTVAIVGAVVSLGKQIYNLGVNAEQTSIAFNTLTGSVAKGQKLLKELTKFSIETPFTPEQVNKAAKSLLAFGVDANKVIPTLKLLGDVSSGTGKDLSEMAVIFGQIRSTGRLMGQDLLQLINAGFNPLQIISEKTGKSVALLKEEMEKGNISFEMVEQAFKDATSEGGLFFDLMKKQSESIGGITSTIAGNFEEMGKQIFDVFKSPTVGIIQAVADFTSSLITLSEEEQRTLRISAHLFLQQQQALLETNQTLEERRRTIQLIVETEKFLGFFKPATTEDPLPWATPEKANNIREIKKAIKFEPTAPSTGELPTEEKPTMELGDPFIEKLNNEMMALIGFGEDRFTEEQKQNARELRESLAHQKELEEQEEQHQQNIADIKQAAFDFSLDLIGGLLLAGEEAHQLDLERLQMGYDEQRRLAGDNERAKRELDIRQAQEEQALRHKQFEEEKKQATRRILIETVLNAVKALGLPPIPGANFIKAAQATAYGLLAAGLSRRYAKGKIDIDGPGTGTSDSIPAMLSKGESVMTARETVESNGILKAIRAKKLDDKLLEKLYKKANIGGDGLAFSDKGIIKAIENQPKIDYTKIGSYIYEVKTKNGTHKQFIRKKYFG